MSFLDLAVERAHRVTFFGKPYHPYFIATDCAMLASLTAAFALTNHFRGISFSGFVIVYALLLALYRLFLSFKRRVFGIESRSFLQDTLLFLLPAYTLISFVVGYPLGFALDLAAVFFPLSGCIIRIGCFLGGCCYGMPWRNGVLYPAAIFSPVNGCRTYRPGAIPQTRVFPIQLVESAGLLSISIFTFYLVWQEKTARGFALPLFLLCYGALRFVLDFFRRASSRPRVGPFSEAQVYSAVVVVLAAAILAVMTHSL